MQSHNPAPSWSPCMAAPQPLQGGHYRSWTSYGTPVFFSPGSPDAAHALPVPAPRSDATGSMYAYASHPYTCLVSAYSAPLDTPPSHNAPQMPPVKARPARPARQTAHPAMAIAQQREQPPPPHVSIRPPEPASSPPSQDERAERSKSTEKKMHPCWMCHKSFDRPSTLRKHLLVHTGHKAYACDTCGRRFGVPSNLNRHAKKCAQRPVNQGTSTQDATPALLVESTAHADAPAFGAAPAPAPIALEAGPSSSASALHAAPAPPEPARGRKRKAPPAMDAGSTDPAGPSSKKERRPRRKKSPTRWVPDSLKLYDLTPTVKATPVPLPPVRPFVDSNGKVLEERDSYSPDVHDTPYHPRGWMGRLPGPGFMDTGGALASSGRMLVF